MGGFIFKVSFDTLGQRWNIYRISNKGLNSISGIQQLHVFQIKLSEVEAIELLDKRGYHYKFCLVYQSLQSPEPHCFCSCCSIYRSEATMATCTRGSIVDNTGCFKVNITDCSIIAPRILSCFDQKCFNIILRAFKQNSCWLIKKEITIFVKYSDFDKL